MPRTIITLQDNIRIEAEASEKEHEKIADFGPNHHLDKTIDGVRPLLIKACKPIITVWKELDKEMIVSQAEVELGLSFEANGNVFIASGKAKANLTVRLTLSPKSQPR